MLYVVREFVCYLVLVLNERPQFALALAAGLLLGLLGVAEARFGRRPLHGLAVVLELHISRGLEAGLVRLHNLLRVLMVEETCSSNQLQPDTGYVFILRFIDLA